MKNRFTILFFFIYTFIFAEKYTVISTLNIRSSESKTSQIVGKLEKNELIEGTDLGTGWIKLENGKGFVNSVFVQKEEDSLGTDWSKFTYRSETRNTPLEIILGIIFFIISKITYNISKANKLLENLFSFLILPIIFILISYIYNPENATSLTIFSIISFSVASPKGRHKYTRSDGKRKDNRYKKNPYIDATSEMSSFCWKTLILTIIYLIYILT